MPLYAFKWLCYALVPLGMFLVVYQFFAVRPLVPPNMGPIGARRIQTRAKHELFRKLEPAILLVAAWFAKIPMDEQRKKLSELLHFGGDWWGLRPDEFLAMSLISGSATFAFCLLALFNIDNGPGLAALLAAIATVYPYVRLKSIVDERNISIIHGLPGAIDIMALAMGAGLDFPGALREVTSKAPDSDAPLVDELGRVLQDLRLGHTRKAALEAFAERAPLESVTDFVGTVVQAEERGNPLAEVLSTQAEVMRNQRSVRAEESASKAAAALIGPLVLVMVLVVVILIGPMAINLASTEF